MGTSAPSWPPPFEGFVQAPAGEPASAGWIPSQDALDYTHKAMQVVFLGLAFLGLLSVLADRGFRETVRGAARKHVISS